MSIHELGSRIKHDTLPSHTHDFAYEAREKIVGGDSRVSKTVKVDEDDLPLVGHLIEKHTDSDRPWIERLDTGKPNSDLFIISANGSPNLPVEITNSSFEDFKDPYCKDLDLERDSFSDKY